MGQKLGCQWCLQRLTVACCQILPNMMTNFERGEQERKPITSLTLSLFLSPFSFSFFLSQQLGQIFEGRKSKLEKKFLPAPINTLKRL
jgi:hypothetical protein